MMHLVSLPFNMFIAIICFCLLGTEYVRSPPNSHIYEFVT